MVGRDSLVGERLRARASWALLTAGLGGIRALTPTEPRLLPVPEREARGVDDDDLSAEEDGLLRSTFPSLDPLSDTSNAGSLGADAKVDLRAVEEGLLRKCDSLDASFTTTQGVASTGEYGSTFSASGLLVVGVVEPLPRLCRSVGENGVLVVEARNRRYGIAC